MNCANTISDGFHFWIGKALAELTVGVSVLVLLGLVGICVVVYANRKSKP